MNVKKQELERGLKMISKVEVTDNAVEKIMEKMKLVNEYNQKDENERPDYRTFKSDQIETDLVKEYDDEGLKVVYSIEIFPVWAVSVPKKDDSLDLKFAKEFGFGNSETTKEEYYHMPLQSIIRRYAGGFATKALVFNFAQHFELNIDDKHKKLIENYLAQEKVANQEARNQWK